MFPQFDSKLFEQFSANPAAFLTKMADFQRANLEAARQIAETNVRAFQELAAIRDPQAFMQVQPAILQAVVERNMEILGGLWRQLGVNLPAPPKK